MTTYKIRKLLKPNATGEGEYVACSIAVPLEIARLLPDGIRFAPELTDEGILYKPVQVTQPTEGALPSWLSDASTEGSPEDNGQAKPKRVKPATAAA